MDRWCYPVEGNHAQSFRQAFENNEGEDAIDTPLNICRKATVLR